MVGRTGAWKPIGDSLDLRISEGGAYTLVSLRVSGAARLDAECFRRRTSEAYESIAAHLRETGSGCPVRFWNAIPRILDPLGDLPHRYMVFNVGRFEALRRWWRRDSAHAREPATASAIGHGGDALVVHCLTASHPGRPIENPRQIPAYRYSSRYGPRPPMFARATRVEETPTGKPWLLVGGTASVRGEDCVYLEDLRRQFDESLTNIQALIRAGSPCTPGQSRPRLGNGVGALNLRIYVTRQEELAWLSSAAVERFGNIDIELVPTELCRPELLVELEGVFEYLNMGGGCDSQRDREASARLEAADVEQNGY